MTDSDLLGTLREGVVVEMRLSDAGPVEGVVDDTKLTEYGSGGARKEVEVQTEHQRITVFGERQSQEMGWSGVTADLGNREEEVEYIGVAGFANDEPNEDDQ